MYENVTHLLTQIGLITRKYDDIAKITGEKFNIFSIMSMETNEVYTHSAFIAELLNPKGSYGFKDTFLKIFIERIDQSFKSKTGKTFFKLTSEKAWTIVEESHGPVDEVNTKGGRIDIVIKDGHNNTILIENKIYAREQPNQIERYSNIYKNTPILFLTLNGHKSQQCGNLKPNEHYFCISYKETITKWLESCLSLSDQTVMIREVIRQYLFLIKKITNQTTNIEMNREIINILKDNIPASFEIFGKEKDLKQYIINEFSKKISGEAKSLGLSQGEEQFDSYKAESAIFFTNDKWKGKDLFLYFEFGQAGFINFYGGLYYQGSKDLELKNNLNKEFNIYQNYSVNSFTISDSISTGSSAKDWIAFDDGTIFDKCKKIINEVYDITNKVLNN